MTILHSAVQTGQWKTVNGMAVFVPGGAPGSTVYEVPSLHVVVSASGQMAVDVLKTITYSPLAVVTSLPLTTGHQPGWQTIGFAGITFQVPHSWPVRQTSDVGSCFLEVTPNTVVLSTAEVIQAFACPLMLVGEPNPLNGDGVSVFAGPHAAIEGGAVTTSRILQINGLKLRVSSSSETGGVFIASISIPGQAQPIVIQVGLTGDGLTAKGIIDSIGLEPSNSKRGGPAAS
jgi:hypothetical protein